MYYMYVIFRMVTVFILHLFSGLLFKERKKYIVRLPYQYNMFVMQDLYCNKYPLVFALFMCVSVCRYNVLYPSICLYVHPLWFV